MARLKLVSFEGKYLAKLLAWLKTLSAFLQFFFFYMQKKTTLFLMHFEKYKNLLVKLIIMKRGRYNRPFLHISAISVMGVGVVIAPLLADTYPIFSENERFVSKVPIAQAQEQSIIVGEDVFQTDISQKPRDQVITYSIQKGDTLSTIAQKFGISVDTIKWANDLTSDDLTVGETLKILPVTGMVHKVAKGETVYTIAKKYDTESQKIVDFPFNEFANPETFSLVEGQTLVVPDAVKPSEKPTYRRQVYIVQGPVSVSTSGFTWPLQGTITQFASWYHMAIDIAAPYGSPVVAAHSGRVVQASSGTWDGGYGTSVGISDGNGLESHYAHLSSLNVSVGDEVIAGKTVLGWNGLTGRTTGPHVHFEIRRDGVLVNPLPYLQ